MQTLPLCQVGMSWHVEDYKTIGWPQWHDIAIKCCNRTAV